MSKGILVLRMKISILLLVVLILLYCKACTITFVNHGTEVLETHSHWSGSLSLTDCQSLCKADITCGGIGYDSSSSKCTISRRSKSRNANNCYNCSFYHKQCGTDCNLVYTDYLANEFADQFYTTLNVSSYDLCLDSCTSDIQCVGVGYDSSLTTAQCLLSENNFPKNLSCSTCRFSTKTCENKGSVVFNLTTLPPTTFNEVTTQASNTPQIDVKAKYSITSSNVVSTQLSITSSNVVTTQLSNTSLDDITAQDSNTSQNDATNQNSNTSTNDDIAQDSNESTEEVTDQTSYSSLNKVLTQNWNASPNDVTTQERKTLPNDVITQNTNTSPNDVSAQNNNISLNDVTTQNSNTSQHDVTTKYSKTFLNDVTDLNNTTSQNGFTIPKSNTSPNDVGVQNNDTITNNVITQSNTSPNDVSIIYSNALPNDVTTQIIITSPSDVTTHDYSPTPSNVTFQDSKTSPNDLTTQNSHTSQPETTVENRPSSTDDETTQDTTPHQSTISNYMYYISSTLFQTSSNTSMAESESMPTSKFPMSSVSYIHSFSESVENSSSSMLCTCHCYEDPNKPTLKEWTSDMRQNLLISRKTLSSQKHKFVSASDPRFSSYVIGMSGVSILVGFGVFFLLFDVSKILADKFNTCKSQSSHCNL